MKKMVIPALALALAACGGGDAQTQKDEQPTQEQMGQEAPQETTEAEQAEEGDGEAKAGEQDVAKLIEEAATGEHRSEANIARNEYRHPVETLTFFGIEPDMTVVELWPGGGWYTEVLAPTLTDGELVAASFAPKPEEPEHYRNRIYKAYEEKLQGDEVYSNVELGMLQPGQKVDMGEPGSADMVVTFRNFHSFINSGIEDEVLAESYKVLEPGGILGVVQHRAPEGADAKESAKTGYVPEAYVIEKAKEAGFELVEKSEINANPKDTKDHPEGVWTLPPSYRLGDKDRAKYEAIGESDRMTLKFRKPAEEKPAEEN
ncbi:class I SAM-dependent methyltransferase [Persicimonas caeni]|uniref:Class I SAM-dependent methyltransferase n=2 Tax=Persicimonas caeni TaxID=2292766 RepID=A0A4Y6PMF1_PERCE|nr:class I SAM-dependent methyltransferase [Persicimonas caeni]QDG49399.1 class I SAM-dependent methyltransferase [Persicimonas caeni]